MMLKKILDVVLRRCAAGNEKMRPELPLQTKYKEGTEQAKNWERGYNWGMVLASLGDGIDEAPKGEPAEYYEGLQTGWHEYGYDD